MDLGDAVGGDALGEQELAELVVGLGGLLRAAEIIGQLVRELGVFRLNSALVPRACIKAVAATRQAPPISPIGPEIKVLLTSGEAPALGLRQQSTIYPPQHSTSCGGSRVLPNTVGCRCMRTRQPFPWLKH
jgi:hypothetical protein